MAFSLKAILGLDGAQFESGLLLAERSSKSSGERIRRNLGGEEGGGIFGGAEEIIQTAAAGFAATELVKKIGEVVTADIEFSESIRKTALDLGVSTDAMQVYARAFGSLDKVRPAMDKLIEAKEKALSGTEEGDKLAESFERLGVSGAQLQSMNLEQLFAAIGDNIHDSVLDTAKLNDEMQVLGAKSGTALNAGFKKGLTEVKGDLQSTGSLLNSTDMEAMKRMEEGWSGLVLGFKTWTTHALAVTANIGSFLVNGRVQGQKSEAEIQGDITTRVADGYRAQNQARWRAEQEARDKEKADAQAKLAIQDQIKSIDGERLGLEEQTRWKGLSADEKRLELAKQRKEIETELRNASGVDAATLRLSEAQIDAALADLRPDKAPAPSHVAHVDVNDSERRGAYVYQAKSMDQQQQANHLLTEIGHKLDKLAANGTRY